MRVDQHVLDFEKLGFGMFVHFGIYSMIGRGEWTGKFAEWDEAEYKALMKQFCPGSMGNIVLTAKQAGAKYITLTAKHHDGFALFDTKGLTEFDAVHSKAGRDLIREFVDACNVHGIVPFFYYATYEFPEWNPLFHTDFEKYLEYIRNSVEILCTQYGKIGGLWFDGNWSAGGDVWQEDKLYGLIRKYQPEAMIINNTGLSKQGEAGHPEIDSVTFERGKAEAINRENAAKYVAGEVCESVNMHWGLAQDFNYKSTKRLIEELCECRKVGVNFLLNVGPDEKGEVPLMPRAIMHTLGQWTELFGEAVYEPKPLWYRKDCRNFILESPDSVYLFCFDLCRRGSANVTYMEGGEGVFEFEDFPYQIEGLHWMDNGEELEFSCEEKKLSVNFTGYAYGTDYCVRVAKAEKI